MDANERAAFLFSKSVCALITALGMISHDLWEIHHGQGQIYTEEAYEGIINGQGIFEMAYEPDEPYEFESTGTLDPA